MTGEAEEPLRNLAGKEHPQLPQLPEAIILHILSLLPGTDQAWSARRVSKAAHAKFYHRVLISARSSDLSSGALQEFYRQHTEDYQQSWLIAARAARGGLPGVQWLHSQGCHWDYLFCIEAVRNGQLKVLKWAFTHSCPGHEHAYIDAVCRGQLPILQWLRQQHPSPAFPWDSKVCRIAARAGRIDILQWARSQNPPCPWSSWVCSAAAERGHLPVVQWLRSQDPPCPWGERVCNVAAASGQLALLQWARQQQPPCPWNLSDCVSQAQKFGHLAVLQWLQSQQQ